MSQRNADAAAASTHVQTMGLPLGKLFYTLWQVTARTFSRWSEYRVLFAHSPERIEFLNETAPGFFVMHRDVLLESVLLNVTQLTGPKTTGRGKGAQSNITICSLAALIEESKPRNAVEVAVAEAAAAATFAWPARHKLLAHLDADTMLDPAAPDVTFGSRQEMNNVLAKIAAVLNVVQLHYEGSTTMFDAGGLLAGADTLLYFLKHGLDAQDAQRDEMFRRAGIDPNHGR